MNFIRWPTIGMRFLRANLSLLRGNWPAPCTSGCSPCKSIAAPCKIGCSIQTYEASPYKNLASSSVENSIFLRTNQKLLRRRFSVQIESFSVQNSMLLRTNRKRSKASPWKTTQRIGRPRIPPPGQQIAEIMFRGKEVVLFVKTFFLPLRNGVVLPSLRRTFSRKC